MFRASVRVWRWAAILLIFLSSPRFAFADPVIAYGVTNVPIGNAELSVYPYYGTYSVNSLGSNGTDGVSVYLGEPDTGAFFSPMTSYLQDGNYMVAKAYGSLDGTNNSLLATVQGGRASPQLYPLSFDYSPLAPQSVTYQIFAGGILTREFTRGTPMVEVTYGYGTYPTVNALMRRTDGTLGTQLRLSQSAAFVFPELLTSAYGDELFIRVNNPGKLPGPVSRLDIFGGGALYDFSFNDLSLGVFGRPHQSFYAATLQARPNWLRVSNFENTNDAPGVLIKLEQLGALNLQCEPFELSASNASLRASAVGTAAGQPYATLGTLQLNRLADSISITFQSDGEVGVQVLTNGGIAYGAAFLPPFSLSIPTNTAIGSITAHARTLENLPGFHLQFAEATAVTIRSDLTVTGDELRLVLPPPFRMENLLNFYVAGWGFGPLTITNEISTAPATSAVRLEIARALNSVVLKWPDPNRLLGLHYAYYGGPDGPYFYAATNPVTFNDPYRSVTFPIVRTNEFTFFRLFYQPSD